MTDAVRDARAALAGHDRVLRLLEGHVERREALGDPASAGAWAQVAGDWAMRNHPGRFCAPRLERALARMGAAHVPGAHGVRATHARRILHVLSEGYETGGHTRLAWRWMERDVARHHEVALTLPGRPVPAPLRAAAAAVHEVGRGDVVARAAGLRALARGFDVVVLHVHPHDPVPALAFAGRDDAGPAVVLVDHADHLFWLGVGVADVVTACRAPAGALAVDRRGVAPERSVLLPVPADAGRRVASRADARAALGLPVETPVLLTVAVAHKFAPVTAVTWFDAAAAALDALPDAVLVAVGPGAADPGWDAFVAAHPGRVRAVGSQRALQPFWDAADVYLDSFPFSSNTSAIEAAAHGLPVVSFAPDPAQQGLLLTHDPGFEDALVRAADPAAYAAAVDEVLRDPAPRGEALAAGVAAAHTGAGWQAHLERVYATALAAPPAAPPADLPPVAPAAWEAIHHLLFRATGMTASLPQVVAFAAGALPAAERPLTAEQTLALCRFTGVAAPGTDATRVRRAVEDLRALRAEGLLERCVVAVAPADVDVAVPLLEAALAAGPDFPLDLVPTEDPGRAAEGRLALVA